MIEAGMVAMISAGIALVVWLVRLESKTNRTADDLQVLHRRLERHEVDKDIHHNADFFSEFEKRIELQFSHIEQSITRLENKLEVVLDHKKAGH